jgi:hypothetical protein
LCSVSLSRRSCTGRSLVLLPPSRLRLFSTSCWTTDVDFTAGFQRRQELASDRRLHLRQGQLWIVTVRDNCTKRFLQMSNILVAGGAGYIGSHTCLDLFNKGFTPIVYDNLSNGHAAFVQWGLLEIGDIRDRKRLDEVLEKYKPQAIVHFAAAIEVAESTRDPGGYYENNVAGTITLLRAAQAAGINKIVFSSTCATYGIPSCVPIKETHAQSPINPYDKASLS